MIEADLLLQINFEDLIKDFSTIEAGIFISAHKVNLEQQFCFNHE
jgi:hypothetical protein